MRSIVASGNDPSAISRTYFALVALLAQQLLTAAVAQPHDVHSHLSHEQNSPLQSGHLQSTQQQEPTGALAGADCPLKPKANVDNAATDRGATSAENRFNIKNPSIDPLNEKEQMEHENHSLDLIPTSGNRGPEAMGRKDAIGLANTQERFG